MQSKRRVYASAIIMTITIWQKRKEYCDRQNDSSRYKDDNEDKKELEEKRKTVESG